MQQRDQALAVGMQKAEIARPAKVLRQHMLQHQPEEVRVECLHFDRRRTASGTKGEFGVVNSRRSTNDR